MGIYIYLSLSLSARKTDSYWSYEHTNRAIPLAPPDFLWKIQPPNRRQVDGSCYLKLTLNVSPRLAVAPRGHPDTGRKMTEGDEPAIFVMVYIILVGGLEHGFFFSHILGMSSSQLTNSIIFQRGRAQPPTRISIANTGHLCQIGDGLHCTHNLAYFSVASPARVVAQGMKKNYFAERMLDMECPSKVVPPVR